MVTRKEFESYQSMRMNKNDLQAAYNDYVNKYKKEQEYQFYHDHKNDPWFIERYHPTENHKIK